MDRDGAVVDTGVAPDGGTDKGDRTEVDRGDTEPCERLIDRLTEAQVQVQVAGGV